MNVGKRIRFLREKLNLSQNGLADKAGISQSHLRRVELEQSDISVGLLLIVCEALGVTINEFFDEHYINDDLSVVIAKLTPKQKKLLIDFLNTLQ